MHHTKRGPKKGEKLSQVKRSVFGARLFATRRARGLSQKQLGKIVGLSKRMISYYESDTPGPPVEMLKKIADALEVTTSYLMHESPLKIPKHDNLNPTARKYIDILKKLPSKEQKHIFHMIELAARNPSEEGTPP